MSNGFIYVVDAHFIDKIEKKKKKKILDPSACDQNLTKENTENMRDNSYWLLLRKIVGHVRP